MNVLLVLFAISLGCHVVGLIEIRKLYRRKIELEEVNEKLSSVLLEREDKALLSAEERVGLLESGPTSIASVIENPLERMLGLVERARACSCEVYHGVERLSFGRIAIHRQPMTPNRPLKVGDLVRILKPNDDPCWISEMNDLEGKEMRVASIYPEHISLKGTTWNFYRKWLHYVGPIGPSFEIWCEGVLAGKLEGSCAQKAEQIFLVKLAELALDRHAGCALSRK
jgi:hypothetical protein